MRLFPKKKDWRMSISLLAITLIFFFLILLLVSPSVEGVSFENSNYKITCLPEISGVRPVGVWFEQVCWFTNKKSVSVEADFAMLFQEQLRSGKVEEWVNVETKHPYVYYCPTEDYGIVDEENVYCTFENDSTQIVYTGTERSFDLEGVGAVVYYNFSSFKKQWIDRTALFDYYNVQIFDKPNAYYVEDVTWQPGQTRTVRFRYRPKFSYTNTKWDALFGDVSTKSIFLRLDPLTNPNFYQSDWVADKETGTAYASSTLFCTGTPDATLTPYIYYTMDNDNISVVTLIDKEKHYNATLRNGVVNGTDGYYSNAVFFDGINDFVNLSSSYQPFIEGKTYSFWFRTNQTTSFDFLGYANFGTPLIFNIKGNYPSTDKLAVYFYPSSGNDWIKYATDTNFSDDSWHHLAVTVTDISNNQVVLYLDSVQLTLYTHQTTGTVNDYQIPQLVIGQRGDSIGYYNGKMDDFRIYESVLSQANINTIFSNPSALQSCDYNSSDFEITWRGANIVYSKSNENINFSFICNGSTSTRVLSARSGSFTENCSNGLTSVNMSYELELPRNASFSSITMTSTSATSINITFKDSKTKQVIDFQNVSLEIIGDYTSRNYTSDTGNIFVPALDNGNFTFRYSAFTDGNTTYPEKFYYFDLTSNATLTLYLTNSTSASNVTIIVYDETGEEVENALVKALRYDITSNSFFLDESALTNFEGKVFFDLELYTEYYKFIVELPSGTVKKSTNGAYITSTDIIIYINRGEDYFNRFFTIGKISYSLNFLNASNNFEYYWNDANSEISRACLQVFTQNNLNGSVLYNWTCVSSTTGTSYVGVQPINGTTYRAIAIVTIDGKDYRLDELWYTFQQENVFGNLGVFLSILLLITMISISRWSLPISMMLFTLTAIFLYVVGVLDVPYYVGIPVFIVGIISAFLISKK